MLQPCKCTSCVPHNHPHILDGSQNLALPLSILLTSNFKPCELLGLNLDLPGQPWHCLCCACSPSRGLRTQQPRTPAAGWHKHYTGLICICRGRISMGGLAEGHFPDCPGRSPSGHFRGLGSRCPLCSAQPRTHIPCWHGRCSGSGHSTACSR